VRHPALLRMHCSNKQARHLLLVDMVTRIAKNSLRAQMRKIIAPAEQPFKEAVASFFNALLGKSEASDFVWRVQLKLFLRIKFGLHGPALTEAGVTFEFERKLDAF
jgi:hypothetical protein